MTSPQQVTMTLAALASTCAAPRPSGENPAVHSNRILAGIRSCLSDSSLATGGTWALVWLAASPDNENLCYIARNYETDTNEFAVVIRGTYASLPDILQDLDVGTVVPFTAGGAFSPSVSKGAMDAFTQVVNARSPQPPDSSAGYPGTTLAQALAAMLASAPSSPQPTVYVTGHSLGGCLATLVAPYLQAQTWPNTPAFAVYTFAAPTAGLDDFATYFTNLKWSPYVRTVNAYDVVPQAWVQDDLKAVMDWYPSPGPAATFAVQAVIGELMKLPNGNAYVQPGDASQLNDDPAYAYRDPDLLANTFDDFMGQAAFQHSNNSYLYLLGAPAIPAGPVVSGLSPAAGQPGTTVTISGSGFTMASVVDFGPIPCQNFSLVTPKQITAVAPAGAGIVDVCVTDVTGSSPAVQGSRFSYS